MVTILAQFRINEGKEAEAEAAIKAMVSAVEKNEPGALLYVMNRSKEDPLEITVFEMYKDGEAAGTHSASEHMGAFRQQFRDVFDASAVKIVQLDEIAAIQR
ncbi:MAG: antibiotic biosynthesis monooxygenase [Chloroflexi bacterium]|nr:antibiotic biosynthesis monooxygenase [Chloroflexota bacterium]